MNASGDQRYEGQFPPAASRLHLDKDVYWVVRMRIQYILGVVGCRWAGKTTALSHLSENRDFSAYSLTGSLRSIARQAGIPFAPRVDLQDLGDEVRAQAGDGGRLARLTLQRIRADHLTHLSGQRPPGRVVVGGFKHPGEVAVFERTGRFRLLVVKADDEVRFKRANDGGLLARELAEIDPELEATRETFWEHIDRRDRQGGDERLWARGFGQSVDDVITAGSDPVTIVNNEHSLVKFHQAVDEVVTNLDSRYRSPR